MKKQIFSFLLLLFFAATAVNAQSIVVGDMNRDGEVTVSDVTALVSVILGTSEKTYITADDFGLTASESTQIVVGDMNRDGEVTVSDVTTLVSVILGTSEKTYITADDFAVSEEQEYVDLGLPSGTLWATRNIGAESPEDYGDYFAWGEVEPHADNIYEWETYKWCHEGSQYQLTKYCSSSYAGYGGFTDGLTELEFADDAAYVNWGSDWRMPSMDQCDELINSEYTTTEWTTVNGVNGMKITSKVDGYTDKSVFLPAAGYHNNNFWYANYECYYWSRTLPYPVGNPESAQSLKYYQRSGRAGTSTESRSTGFSVRPVRI